MKRFLSILLVAMLVVTCLATAAFATETSKATVSVSSVDDAVRGNEYTVTYTVKGNFANFELMLKAGDGLELVSVDKNGNNLEANLNESSAKYGKVAYASSSNVEKVTFKVTYKVKSNAACGKHAVTASVIFISGEDLVDQEYSINAGYIHVGHDLGNVPVITEEATCTTPEKIGYRCNVCKEIIYVDGDPALGHDYVGTVTTKPTCTEPGVMTYVCQNDASHTYTEAIDPLGHDYDVVVTTKPTCTEPGVKTYTCKHDSSHTYTEDIDPLGHNYDGVVTKEPTCTEPGVMTYTCKNDASHTYTEAIDPLGHVFCEDFECDHDHEHYDDDYHWFLCLICGEKVDVEKHVYGEEVNGYRFCKCGHWIEVQEPGIDPEPDKGDNTLELTLGFLAVVSLMAAAAYVCKRKFAK